MSTLIGIDPGLAATGYGIVRFDGSRFFHVGHGVVHTDPDAPLPERLQVIYRNIRELVSEFRPVEAGIEELYFSRNASSAMAVAHARGVVLLALGEAGVPVGCYSPQQVKAAVLGRGKGDKDQVQRLVAVLLGMDKTPCPDHAADALAVAICHANRSYVHVQQHLR